MDEALLESLAIACPERMGKPGATGQLCLPALNVVTRSPVMSQVAVIMTKVTSKA